MGGAAFRPHCDGDCCHDGLSGRAGGVTLNALRAALDEIDYGILLLDSALRAVFINRACRRMWRLTDAEAERGDLTFADLFRLGQARGAFPIPTEALEAHIATRVAEIIEGGFSPLDMRGANGEVIRLICTPLAGDGRMLTYVDVTEQVRAEQQLQSLVFSDHLTGVLNRRGLMEAGQRECARAARQSSPFSVIILDADHFKKINDNFGHDIGDRVLIEIAKTCSATARVSDVVGRIGGEEFAILLPDTPLDGGATLAERLRQAIATAREGEGVPPFTVSLGVAASTAGDLHFEDVLKRADQALYRAKQGGRNRIELDQPPRARTTRALEPRTHGN